MQNVALTWFSASRSRTSLVYPLGPSSKVSATAEVPVPVSEPNGPWPPPEPPEPPSPEGADGADGGVPPDLAGAAGPAGLALDLGPVGAGESDDAGAGSGGVSPLS